MECVTVNIIWNCLNSNQDHWLCNL